MLITVLKIPVYVGATDGLVEKYKHIGPPFHGEDGFGNTKFDKHPDLSKIQTDEPACIAMLRMVKQSSPGIDTLMNKHLDLSKINRYFEHKFTMILGTFMDYLFLQEVSH